MKIQEFVNRTYDEYGEEAAIAVATHLEEVLDVEQVLAAEEAGELTDSLALITEALASFDYAPAEPAGPPDLDDWIDYERWLDFSQGAAPDEDDGNDHLQYLVWRQQMGSVADEYAALKLAAAENGLELTDEQFIDYKSSDDGRSPAEFLASLPGAREQAQELLDDISAEVESYGLELDPEVFGPILHATGNLSEALSLLAQTAQGNRGVDGPLLPENVIQSFGEDDAARQEWQARAVAWVQQSAKTLHDHDALDKLLAELPDQIQGQEINAIQRFRQPESLEDVARAFHIDSQVTAEERGGTRRPSPYNENQTVDVRPDGRTLKRQPSDYDDALDAILA